MLSPIVSLHEVPARPPEPAQRPNEAESGLDFTSLPSPAQSRAQIVVLALEPVHPRFPFRARRLRPSKQTVDLISLLRQTQEMGEVPPLGLFDFPALL